MQIGINRWTMPADWALDRCFAAAAAAGFDTIEVNAADEGTLNIDSADAEVKAILAQARAQGVGISSLSNGLGWKYPLTAADADARRQAAEVVRKMLRIASLLEVDTLLCVPGGVTPEVPYDAAYDRALEQLRALAPAAEKAGVRIGVENVWNRFLLSPLEMARFIDEVGSPWVGAYFDAGNVLVTGYPQHWIRILGRRILKVHVKDFKASIGNITAFCNPLQGDVPWAEVRTALEEVGYDGPITAEVDGYRVHPEIGLRHIAECLRAVFA